MRVLEKIISRARLASKTTMTKKNRKVIQFANLEVFDDHYNVNPYRNHKLIPNPIRFLTT